MLGFVPSSASGRSGRAATTAVVVLLSLVAVGSPVVLHVLQRRHNVLAFDVATRFPDDQPVVPGEVLATTVIALVDHELTAPSGWRPNDFLLWGPRVLADNNANRQLGILQIVRETVRVMKDHLTKVSSDDYDKNLVDAYTALNNDPRRWMLPSAESRIGDGMKNLQRYVDGLRADPKTSKPLNGRNVELIRLFQAWMDQLGAAHAILYRDPASFTTGDDDFYYAQGMTHAVAHLTPAVWREYRDDLQSRPVMHTLFDEITVALSRAAVMKPLFVMSGGEESIFANHRRNLDTFLTEARQKMYSIREELEK